MLHNSDSRQPREYSCSLLDSSLYAREQIQSLHRFLTMRHTTHLNARKEPHLRLDSPSYIGFDNLVPSSRWQFLLLRRCCKKMRKAAQHYDCMHSIIQKRNDTIVRLRCDMWGYIGLSPNELAHDNSIGDTYPGS